MRTTEDLGKALAEAKTQLESLKKDTERDKKKFVAVMKKERTDSAQKLQAEEKIRRDIEAQLSAVEEKLAAAQSQVQSSRQECADLVAKVR